MPDIIDIGHINPTRIENNAAVYAERQIIPADYSLEGFIYSPPPEVDEKMIYRLMAIIAGLICLSFGGIFVFYSFNKKLKNSL